MGKRSAKPARKKPAAKRRRAAKGQGCTDAQVERLLELMLEGQTMTRAARTIGVPPQTACDRLKEPRYAERYGKARVIASHALVDEAEDALNPANDGALLAPHQVTLRVARAKQKLWRAGRLNPEYAEKHVVTHEGSQDKPVQHNVTMTPSEAYQRMLSGG